MIDELKNWRNRVTAVVVSKTDTTVIVAIGDKGTRRTSASDDVGRMTLQRIDGRLQCESHKPSTWGDARLRAWCTRVGGGVYRSAALVHAARDAANLYFLRTLK